MRNLVVKKILDFNNYILEDSAQNEFNLVIELYDLPKFSIGDTLMIVDGGLLNKNSDIYTQPYSFQIAEDANGNECCDEDFAIAIISNKKYYLQRIYG